MMIFPDQKQQKNKSEIETELKIKLSPEDMVYFFIS